jgi:hypothetical protein
MSDSFGSNGAASCQLQGFFAPPPSECACRALNRPPASSDANSPRAADTALLPQSNPSLRSSSATRRRRLGNSEMPVHVLNRRALFCRRQSVRDLFLSESRTLHRPFLIAPHRDGTVDWCGLGDLTQANLRSKTQYRRHLQAKLTK